MKPNNRNRVTFVLPRHPDDDHIPDSIINLYLGPGKIVTIQAPLWSKTWSLLAETFPIWKDAMVLKDTPDDDVPDDYQI